MAVQPQEAIKPLTVLELNTRIHDLPAARFQSVVVKGEVGGVTLRGGHVWFTLKDAVAAVGAVIFSSTARRLPFLPENGQELVVTCQVDYHAQYGRVNLVVSKLDYDGAGKLRAAIEQLKRRLEAEGAFRPDKGVHQIVEALTRKPELHVADIFSVAANDNFFFVVGEA